MYRFSVYVYIDNSCIFYKCFKSITSVAKFLDCFMEVEKNDIWFDISDDIRNMSIDSKELLRIWRS